MFSFRSGLQLRKSGEMKDSRDGAVVRLAVMGLAVVLVAVLELAVVGLAVVVVAVLDLAVVGMVLSQS
jgi:hypothetical protein